jgi:RNA polymerase sigma factor (TIGR02999 family)
MPASSPDVPTLLSEARDGAPVLDDLLPLMYDELRRLARAQRRRLRPYETLNTTALVHEAYLKLAGRDRRSWNDRMHFFRVAARAMRDVVVDYARRQQAAKRGGDAPHVSLGALPPLAAVEPEEVLALHEALGHLEAVDARQARVVELRYFVGLTIDEAAEVLSISPATVKRDWTSARAWLFRHIHAERASPAADAPTGSNQTFESPDEPVEG